MPTTLKLAAGDLATAKSGAVVVGLLGGPDGPRLTPGSQPLEAAFGDRLLTTLVALGATGREGEVVKLPTNGALAAPVLAASSAGTVRGPEGVRRLVGAALRALAGTPTVAVDMRGADRDHLRAALEGALLGAYQFTRYAKPRAAAPTTVTVLVDDPKDKAAVAELRRATAVAGSVALVRDLVNTSPLHLHPEDLAATAREVAAAADLAVEVLDEKALRKGGYGGILGVGQGSAHPPRLIRLEYAPARAERTVVLVGKGITFDSGGLSLKPAQGMEWMKSDMAGAAAVLGTMRAIAALKPRVRVVGYLPAAENMPSGTAIRPSDVLTTYAGRTVEVLNTDAEGRLILVDAIARGLKDSPDVLVDVATLTGAQLVALGSRTAGVMGNDDGLRAAVCDAAERAGELAWPMPLPAELRPSLDSAVADIANIGERNGGMMTAAVFMREWVPDDVRWAHLDIAGPAFNQGEAWGATPKGGTGYAVRTLVQLVEDVAAGRLDASGEEIS